MLNFNLNQHNIPTYEGPNPFIHDPRPTFWNEGVNTFSASRDWNGSGQSGTGQNGAGSGWNGSNQNGHTWGGGLN